MSKVTKPGMMLYFDTIESIVNLSHEQQGELFMACYNFAKDGLLPKFSSPEQNMAWHFFQIDLTRRNKAYHKRCIDNAYTAYAREAKKKGNNILEFPAWIQIQKKYSKKVIEIAGYEEYLPLDSLQNSRLCPDASFNEDDDPLA